MHAWYLRRSEEGIGSLGIEVTDGTELPGGCWELNSGPLEEQPVFLTAKSTLRPLLIVAWKADIGLNGLR